MRPENTLSPKRASYAGNKILIYQIGKQRRKKFADTSDYQDISKIIDWKEAYGILFPRHKYNRLESTLRSD
jgi:hypothetical protein